MPAFRYEAISAVGKTDKGTLEADSAKHVRQMLNARALTPILVEQIDTGNSNNAFGMKQAAPGTPVKVPKKSLSRQDQTLFTRQLASLLTAGLPLETALQALGEGAEKSSIKALVGSIRAEVQSGSSLSTALGRHPKDFPDIFRSLAAAGEESGNLALVLNKLADYVEARNSLTQKITLAFTYPAIVSTVALAIVIFLLSYVVPQVVSVFANTKQALPLLTRMMLGLSNAVRSYGWLAAIVVALVAFAIYKLLQQPALRLAWHKRLLNLPLVGKLVKGFNTARFASTLAILTSAGVPILRALESAAETMGNLALRTNVEDAIVRVREGSGLARALAVQNQFPPVLIHLIRSGEATGQLPPMLERAANGQAQELERRTLTLTSLLEPALILSMGLFVLLIVLAVLMPIIEINQMVR